jgi:hypothetical protein
MLLIAVHAMGQAVRSDPSYGTLARVVVAPKKVRVPYVSTGCLSIAR